MVCRLQQYGGHLNCVTFTDVLKMDFSDELSKFEEGSKEHIFFQRVFEKLGPNFIRKSVEEEKRKVHNSLNNAMQNYFQSFIFVTALTKSAEQLETSQGTDPPLSSALPIYLNSVRKYLPSEFSEKPKVFGLSQENTLKTLDNKNSEFETATLKMLVEDNINDFCKELVQCTGGTLSDGGVSKNAFERTIKDLEYKVTLLSCEETKERSKKQVREMLKTYNEELTKEVFLLTKLLSLHEKKLEFESNLAKFYLYRCHAVFLKIKMFEMKMLEMTYNQETVPALQKISVQLDQTEQKLQEEQNEKIVALEQYLKLGEEYERFVNEYAQLTKSIKEQQWAIDELKSKKSQYGASGHS